MKKFFFTLIILLILCGTGFFVGWVQFSVPPGSYGVINSKTHGVDPALVRSGEFRWLWYKLLPTNVKIAVFRLDPVKYTVNFNSSLPSGESYAAFAGLGADFSWELRASMSFGLNPENLISLAAGQNLNGQEALNAYLQDIAQNIEILILSTFTSVDIDTARLENILAGNPDEAMEREIARRYPEIRNFSFSVQSARFPDFILYRQVRLLYEDFLSKQHEVVAAGFGTHADKLIAGRLQLAELERYGELLTRFPVLLDYLSLERSTRTEQ